MMLNYWEIQSLEQHQVPKDSTAMVERQCRTCGGLSIFVKFVKLVAVLLLFQIIYMLVYGIHTTTPDSSNLNTVNETEIAIRIMENVTRMLNMSRSSNQTFIDEFKNQLAAVNTQFILSQDNVKIGESLHFSINRDKTQKIDKKLHQLLPKISPFANRNFDTCSVVGSGGILRDSGCGKAIDMADYIFRCNAAPVKGFTNDAGKRTNLTTVNQSVVWRRFHSLKGASDRKVFVRKMQAEETDFLLPIFSVKAGYNTGKKILETMTIAKNPPLRAFSIHPQHYTSTQEFWKTKGLLRRLSTGFYLTSVAISLCKEVNLYGFWPFSKDLDGNTVPYHYYDKLKLDNTAQHVHNLPEEFRTLLQLHQDAIINLQLHPCEVVGP